MLLAIWANWATAAPCEEPFRFDALLDNVVAIEQAVAEGRDFAAARTAVTLRQGLLCLDAPLPEIVAPRALRAMGVGLDLGTSPEGAEWLQLAAVLDPGHQYADDHPGFTAWRDALEERTFYPFEALPSHTLVPGVHYVDGRRLDAPGAELGLPHVYQHQPPEGPIRSFLIEGTAFPAELVVAPALPDPSPVVPEEPLVPARRRWSGERIALVTGGAVAIASAGVLWGLSTRSEAQFREATTQDDIDRYRDATNRLVVGASATAGFGVAALGLGLLAGSSAPTPTSSFTVTF